MKASEMTNEQLSKKLKRYITKSVAKEWPAYAETILDAAARLRRPTPVDDDLLKMARDIDNLRAKLKVAEDALYKVVKFIRSEVADNESHDEYTLPSDAVSAIGDKIEEIADAIREEGDAR